MTLAWVLSAAQLVSAFANSRSLGNELRYCTTRISHELNKLAIGFS